MRRDRPSERLNALTRFLSLLQELEDAFAMSDPLGELGGSARGGSDAKRSDQRVPVLVEGRALIVEPPALVLNAFAPAPVLAELSGPFRLAGDPIGLPAQPVCQLVGAMDALLVGCVEGP